MSIRQQTVDDFLGRLAAKTPAPGGGAVAGVTGATAAAMASMVVAYSLGKKTYAEHEELLQAAATELETTRSSLLELADEDAEAYAALRQVLAMPEDDPERATQQPIAALRCLNVPRETLTACLLVLEVCKRIAGRSNRMLASDLAIAAAVGEAAAVAAAWNVEVNLESAPSDGERAAIRKENERILADVRRLREIVESECRR